jgi:mannose-6-phosphate isomerase-like protein (cupin superfamily)
VQLEEKLRNRLRATPLWPLLRFGKRCVLSGLEWVRRHNPFSLLIRPRRNSGSFLTAQVRDIELPLREDSVGGWAAYGLFDGPTRNLDSLSCHASVLSAGKTPHELHEHAEEEILVMLSGQAELVIAGATPQEPERRESIAPWSLVYYPSGQRHTIHNPGPGSATYLMLKWKSDKTNGEGGLATSLIQSPHERTPYSHPGSNGFATAVLLDGSTKYLSKLHCHMTTLEPGGGYPPHADAYDVAIVPLRGRIETLGRELGPHGAVFYAADSTHGMRSTGDVPAIYLVFELHGRYSAQRGS